MSDGRENNAEAARESELGHLEAGIGIEITKSRIQRLAYIFR
jgi:hypothetical protein